MCLGWRWGASQPWKLQSLPEVQTESTSNFVKIFSIWNNDYDNDEYDDDDDDDDDNDDDNDEECLTIFCSSWVSMLTRSMHISLQMFLASSQLAWGWFEFISIPINNCFNLFKYISYIEPACTNQVGLNGQDGWDEKVIMNTIVGKPLQRKKKMESKIR